MMHLAANAATKRLCQRNHGVVGGDNNNIMLLYDDFCDDSAADQDDCHAPSFCFLFIQASLMNSLQKFQPILIIDASVQVYYQAK